MTETAAGSGDGRPPASAGKGPIGLIPKAGDGMESVAGGGMDLSKWG